MSVKDTRRSSKRQQQEFDEETFDYCLTVATFEVVSGGIEALHSSA